MKKIYFFLLFVYGFVNAQYSISNTERIALITIYNQNNGENWSQKWDLTADPYYWRGVKISNGHVSELSLNGNILEGDFPNSVLNLTFLKKLDLSSNRLSGNVPSLSNLINLEYLNISDNDFSGDLYGSISSLTQLKYLLIGGNNTTLSSTNFSSFSKLEALDISKNLLSEVPSSLAFLTSLKILNISNNNIANYSNLTSLIGLEELNISGNSLSQIPSEVAGLSNLKSLNVSNNTISNFAVLTSLVNLEWFSLENNSLQNIPSEISNLQNLIHLNLGRNIITSGFTPVLGLAKLEQLWLNHNIITGNFPSEILSLPHLMSLSLQSNNLSGSIPINLPQICNISNNKYTASEIQTYLDQNPSETDFVYSPQRYDEAKTEKAILGSSISLTQLLSSTEGYNFTWYKTLDKKTSVNTERYNINSVQVTDYDIYTCEAILIKDSALYILDFANFREPLALEETVGLGTESPEEKMLVIYPNPVKDFLNIKNKNHKIESISLYDLTGKLIYTGEETMINMQNLPSSTYILNIKTNQGFHNFKIIKK